MKLAPLIKQPIIHYSKIPAHPDTKDPNNTACTICKITYNSRNYYLKHMKSFHKRGRDTPVCKNIIVNVNPTIQPDPNYPNLYCRSCQKSYATRSSFHEHIRSFHPDTKVETVKRMYTINPVMVEMDNGDFSNRRCTICQKDYSCRRSYRKHMNLYHSDGGKGRTTAESSGMDTERDDSSAAQ